MACRLSSAAEEFADRLGDDSVRQDDRHVEHGEGVAVPLGKADAVEHVSFTPSEPTIHRLNRRSLQCQSGYLPASGAAGPSIAVDDDGLAFRTYNRRLARQVSDE